jgi:hypothetical protein
MRALVEWRRGLDAGGGASAQTVLGDELRLVERIEHARLTNQTFTIAVFGGSMTWGVGCDPKVAAGCPWPVRLQALLANETRPRVRVVNMALSATCTGCVLSSLGPRVWATAPDVSLVVWDYSANDKDLHKAAYHRGTKSDLRVAAGEAFVRLMSCLPSRPAVLLVESNARVAAHMTVARHYRVSTLEYHMVSKAVNVPPLLEWKGARGSAEVHPPWPVHHALAELVAWWWRRPHGPSLAQRRRTFASVERARLETLRARSPKPSEKYDARHFEEKHYHDCEAAFPRALTPPADRAIFRTCVQPLTMVSSGGEGLNATIEAAATAAGASWSYSAADAGGRSDKRGWLGVVRDPAGDAASRTIKFELELSATGTVAISVLRSYEGMARVLVRLDDGNTTRPIDGLWTESSSMRSIVDLDYGSQQQLGGAKAEKNKLYVPNLRPGRHTLSFELANDRPPGSKFKLFALITC